MEASPTPCQHPEDAGTGLVGQQATSASSAKWKVEQTVERLKNNVASRPE